MFDFFSIFLKSDTKFLVFWNRTRIPVTVLWTGCLVPPLLVTNPTPIQHIWDLTILVFLDFLSLFPEIEPPKLFVAEIGQGFWFTSGMWWVLNNPFEVLKTKKNSKNSRSDNYDILIEIPYSDVIKDISWLKYLIQMLLKTSCKNI